MKRKWCLFGTLLLMQFQPILAQETTPIQGTVQVSYIGQDRVKSYHNTSIRVEGPGEVVYKDEILRHEERNYLMSEDDKVEIFLKPNRNAEVEGVYLDEEKVQGPKVYTYLVYGSNQPQEIIVRFSSLKKDIPNTGTSIMIINYVLLATLSLFVILIWKLSREKEESKHELND